MNRTSSIFVVSALVVALLSGCQASNSESTARTQISEDDSSNSSLKNTNAQSNNSEAGKEAPVSEREETFFLNEQQGWKAEYSFYGMHREDMILSKTIDGGKTWSKIVQTSDANSSLPGGVKSGIMFLNESKGWITTNAPWQGKLGLYMTIDGGLSWKEQTLEVPAAFKESQLFVYPPLFISNQEGILVTKPELTSSLIYLTNDGGEHWKPVANEKNGTQNGFTWSLSEEGIYSVVKDKTWTLDTSGSSGWIQ